MTGRRYLASTLLRGPPLCVRIPNFLWLSLVDEKEDGRLGGYSASMANRKEAKVDKGGNTITGG